MRVLTWNILHRGGRRVAAICAALESQDTDVLVLTEYRENRSGQEIRGHLSRAGCQSQHSASTPPTRNSVLVATREPSEHLAELEPSGELAERFVAVRCGGVTILGVYFAMNHQKIPLFEHLLALPEQVVAGPSLLIGDFNTGKHYLDQQGATFNGTKYLDALEARGWRDAWRLLHGDQRSYSWWSPKGNGYRVDHAYCTSDLAGRIRMAEHIDGPREARVTDHAGLVVEVDASGLVQAAEGSGRTIRDGPEGHERWSGGRSLDNSARRWHSTSDESRGDARH